MRCRGKVGVVGRVVSLIGMFVDRGCRYTGVKTVFLSNQKRDRDGGWEVII